MTKPPQVRAARLEDAESIARIHVAAWQRAYRGMMPDAFLDGLSLEQRLARWRVTLGAAPVLAGAPERVFVVVDPSDRARGWIAVGAFRDAPNDAGVGELMAINLEPTAWGGGFAAPLLAAGERALVDLGYSSAVLWVVSANTRARKFYEKHGWAWDSVEKTDDSRGFLLHELRYAKRLTTKE